MSLLRRGRGRLAHEVRRLRRRLDRATAPRLSAACLQRVLSSLSPADVVMVHSSLSSCGDVVGGVDTVVDALVDWAGPRTLALPTHTYCYADDGGVGPLFDPAVTPSVVGAVTNAWWRRPGVVRSLHATHSLAARGPAAEDLVAGHVDCDTPCGAGTPYARVVDAGGSVLMFGATLNAYTLFHTAEDEAAVPYLYLPAQSRLRVRLPSGAERETAMWRQDMTRRRRFADVDRWLEARALLVRRRLGRGVLLFVPDARAAHRALVDQLRRDPWFLVANEARP